jgi:hypothetical protein
MDTMFAMKPRMALNRLACASALWVLAVTVGLAEEMYPAADNMGSYHNSMIREVVRETIAEMGYSNTSASTGSGCGPSCCDCCSCSPCCCVRWEVGVEATYARAIFSGDSSNTAFGETATDVFVERGVEVEEFAPRFWVEAPISSCLGARARYWFFDGSDSVSVAEPDDNELETATTDFEMQVLDVEATYHWNFCGWSLITSGGLRYLRTDTVFTEVDSVLATGVVEFIDIESLEFEGFGPTIALEARAPVPCCCGLSLFLHVRGSFVGGDREDLERDIDITGGLDNDTFTAEREDIFWVTDWQAGLEYKTYYACRELFLRGTVEAIVFDTTIPPSPFGRPAESFGVLAFSAAAGLRW